ncbi:MAG: isoleucine--tRNA ligase, partial [Candidatus Dormibacteria bacterium]
TYHNRYIESVWAVLKQVWDQGRLYRGYKVVPYCPRCMTPLSTHELSLGYQDNVKDPSVYPLFELTDEPGTYLLAWTTTPWTLPGNVALAVGPAIKYVKVQNGDRKVILAEGRLEVLDGDYEVLQQLTASDLVGKTYRPLYEYLLPDSPAFFVVEADFVSVADGTGIVHTAAAYGEDDLRLCQEKGIPVRHVVDLRGRFLPEVLPFAGMFVKDADVPIMVDLSERGLLYKKGTIRHTYPFCWRCNTPLLYYAMDSWFIRMSDLRDKLIAENAATGWHPAHVGEGRMGNWLESLQDWSLSRLRYWGTPLPIWECTECDHRTCIGSTAELGLTVDQDLHRPYIDQVVIACEECSAEMRRVPDLVDVWFDSGSMPYAQYHVPFENADLFASQFPADFICEGVDQTRGWFYSLLAVGVLVSGQTSYRNVVVNGIVVDKDGKKMSKSLGNVAHPMPVIERYGADAVRWYMVTSTSIGNEYRYSDDAVQDAARRFLMTLWNTYSFFVTYANLDGFVPGVEPDISLDQRPLLDRWLLSELNLCVERMTVELEDFDAFTAGRALEGFVNVMSTWYVRRSRRRFWKSESDADKLSAYQVLHRALQTVATLVAPFAPFIAEEMYLNLTRASAGARDSVHLADWPQADPAAIDHDLTRAMTHARRLVEAGHRERDQRQLKVRQPLAGATVPGPPLQAELEAIVLDELNLKSIAYGPEDAREVVLDTRVTPELRLEGLARDIVRRIQETRKLAGFNIEDRVEVRYRAEAEVVEAIRAWSDRIAQETLALSLTVDTGLPLGTERAVDEGWFEREMKVEGAPMWLALRRVGNG